MKFNARKFFELAKERGFDASDIYFHRNYSLSMSIFHGKVDSFTQNDSYSLTARGIINGKFGAVTTEAIDKDTPQFLVEGIERTAKIIENNDPSIIYKGSSKYHKKNLFRDDIATGNIEEKTRILLEIEQKLKNFDKRVNEVVTVGYEEGISEDKLSNSYGLKLYQKQADYTYFAEITVKAGEEIRSGFKVFSSIDPNEFNVDNFVRDVANDALEKLGSIQCKTKNYPVVLNPKAASILLSCLLSSLDAEEVQKHSSLFEGKLNQQVISKKLTIMENPLKKTIFFRYFDDEGVATNKKFLFKNGVLKTYLYTLRTAKIDGVEPTGNGYRTGSKAVASTALVSVKPGKKTEEEIFSSIKEGVYLNNLEGMHAGMNSHSGNFSLQCSGFLIKNGKLAEPLSLITVADNLLNLFNNIKEIGNNIELVNQYEMECPSMLIKKMAISGN